MADIGYARVSTKEQDVSLQVEALKKAGVTKIFTDYGVSGAVPVREGLQEALDYLREGDTLVVWKLDRLGRNTRHLLELIDNVLAPQKVGLKSLTEQIDTTTPMGRLFFTLMGALAEMERELIRERSRGGMALARERGLIGGRPPVLTKQQIKAIKSLHGSVPATVIASQFNISRAQVYRVLDGSAGVKA